MLPNRVSQLARLLKRRPRSFRFEAPHMATQMGSDRWWVFVEGRVHGPFTRAQMLTFTEEGRIAADTNIRAHTDTQWRIAGDVAWLAGALLTHAQPNPKPANDREGQAHPAKPINHLLVWAEIRSGVNISIADGVAALGPYAEITPGFWAIQCEGTVEDARKMLLPRLGVGDRMLVIDASHDRIGWINLGPVLEAKLKALWRDPNLPPPANDVRSGR